MSLARQVEAHHLVEVFGRLVRRESQVGGADLDELALRAQSRQGQRRVGAGGDHQVQLGGRWSSRYVMPAWMSGPSTA